MPRTHFNRHKVHVPDTPDPDAYRSRVMINVLNAVMEAGSVEGEDECMVELQMAVVGVCDAIAMLVAASRHDKSPKDRRDTADLCRKAVLTAANGIARKLEAGEQLPWTMRPMGELN